MAAHSVNVLISGLEFSPIPHLLVQDGKVEDLTTSCLNLLGCESKSECVGSSIYEWVMGYDSQLSHKVALTVRNRQSQLFSVWAESKLVSVGQHQIEVISLHPYGSVQSLQTRQDINLLTHVVSAPMSELHSYIQERTPQLCNVAVTLNKSLQKFTYFKRIEAGSFSNRVSKVDLLNLLRQIVEVKQELHKDHSEISTEIPEEMDHFFLDQQKVEFILDEIIQNAIAHNSKAKINVSLEEIEEAGTKYCVIKVEDDGKGFSTCILEKADTSLPISRVSNGGIGLAICKAFVKDLSGRLDIESSDGTGTIVTVKLPFQIDVLSQSLDRICSFSDSSDSPLRRAFSDSILPRRAPAKTKAKRSASVKEKQLTQYNYRVLIADDNQMCRGILQKMLEKHGITCELVCDGDEALAKIQEDQNFNLIFMDVMMPRMNGRDASVAIDQICKTKGVNIPIIACTANQEDVDLCKEAHMSEFLPKPLNPNLLSGLLRKVSKQMV